MKCPPILGGLTLSLALATNSKLLQKEGTGNEEIYGLSRQLTEQQSSPPD